MGNKNKKKMNLSSILKSSTSGLLSIPLCYNNANKTLSFRHHNNDIVKTVNSIFFDNNNNDKDLFEIETPESWFTSETSSTHHSTTESDSDKSLETVVRGVIRSSDRLFFDPSVTSCKLDQKKHKLDQKQNIEKISVAVAMESEDPYSDFRRSMEEMVMSHGELVRDWESLESMLAWYLKMNVKKSHGVIVSAFVDLLAALGGAGTSSSESARYSTAVSSSLPSSPLFLHGSSSHEIEEEEERRSV